MPVEVPVGRVAPTVGWQSLLHHHDTRSESIVVVRGWLQVRVTEDGAHRSAASRRRGLDIPLHGAHSIVRPTVGTCGLGWLCARPTESGSGGRQGRVAVEPDRRHGTQC